MLEICLNNKYFKDMNNPFLTNDHNNADSDLNLTITENAIKRLQVIFESENDKVFRVKISGGGCSGFQYDFDMDSKFDDNDFTIPAGDITVAVDKQCMELINNGEIDFINSLTGQYFVINNPNATDSCGCGSSFSV